MKVYSYVLTDDTGGAPNYDPPFTTLAICKPKIRLRAEIGDVVIGFSGAKLRCHPHSVRWAGIVKEKLTFEQYWHDPRFAAKKPKSATDKTADNIYKPDGLSGFIQVENDKHCPGEAATDLSGKYVLIFDPSWCFGEGAPILPEDFGLWMRGRRGERINAISVEQWHELKGWLDG